MDREYSWCDVLVASTLQELTEASLGRIFQHWKSTNSKSFSILTRWRVYGKDGKLVSKQENTSNLEKLKENLKQLGLGYFSLDGVWAERESDSQEVKKDEFGKEIVHLEPSFFISNITLDQAKKLAFSNETWNQDAIIYAGPEVGGKVVLVLSDGTIGKTYDKFLPNKIAVDYFKLRGGRNAEVHSFVFETINYPQTWGGAISRQICVLFENKNAVCRFLNSIRRKYHPQGIRLNEICSKLESKESLFEVLAQDELVIPGVAYKTHKYPGVCKGVYWYHVPSSKFLFSSDVSAHHLDHDLLKQDKELWDIIMKPVSKEELYSDYGSNPKEVAYKHGWISGRIGVWKGTGFAYVYKNRSYGVLPGNVGSRILRKLEGVTDIDIIYFLDEEGHDLLK